MTSEAKHSVRNSLRDKETVFRLTEEAAAWDNGSQKDDVPYQNIEQINLITYGADIADPEDIHG